MLTQHLVHPPVDPFVVAAEAAREHQHPGAGMADDVEVHVAAERGTVPVVVLDVHGSAGRQEPRQRAGESPPPGPLVVTPGA